MIAAASSNSGWSRTKPSAPRLRPVPGRSRHPRRNATCSRPCRFRDGGPVLRDRSRGSLLGNAIDDALGSAFEFVSGAAIERAIGGSVARELRAALPGSLLAPRPAGIPTDDTAMTLALIAALTAPPELTPAALFKRLVAELRRDTGRYADIFWDGGPGGACVAMLRAAESGAGPFEGLNPNAGGNGAAMRVHPCGAFADRAFVADLPAMQAKLSHQHPGAVAAAQVVALIVHDGLHTGRLTTELPAEITGADMTQAWERAHRDLRRGERLPRHLLDVDMAGWNTVAAAHAIAQLYADDLETGIGIAAASGQDTDTVASITGALLGAVHGGTALPERWIAALQHREKIEAAAEGLCERTRR